MGMKSLLRKLKKDKKLNRAVRQIVQDALAEKAADAVGPAAGDIIGGLLGLRPVLRRASPDAIPPLAVQDKSQRHVLNSMLAAARAAIGEGLLNVTKLDPVGQPDITKASFIGKANGTEQGAESPILQDTPITLKDADGDIVFEGTVREVTKIVAKSTTRRINDKDEEEV